MRKNAEKMDLSFRNRLLRVPAGSHGFWAHDPLPDPPGVMYPRSRVRVSAGYTPGMTISMIKRQKRSKRAKNDQKRYFVHLFQHKQAVF